MRRQSTNPDTFHAAPKVIMESELVNPLNRQLRRFKRHGSQQIVETKKHDKQLEDLVVKLQEKTEVFNSPKTQRQRPLSVQKSASAKNLKQDEAITALSTQKSLKPESIMTEPQTMQAVAPLQSINLELNSVK